MDDQIATRLRVGKIWLCPACDALIHVVQSEDTIREAKKIQVKIMDHLEREPNCQLSFMEAKVRRARRGEKDA